MSRSYKHTPRCGDQKTKFAKRQANRRVRLLSHEDALPQHMGYKKLFCSWDICDYETVGETFAHFYEDEVTWYRLRGKPVPTRADSKNRYEKWYIRK